MATSATHIRKRQFQPTNQTTLDSFFNRDGGPRSPMSPPLPADIQASLLSVGMRVRKAVPEGYKQTHKTISQAGFPLPSSAPSMQRPIYSTPSRPILSQTSSRELAPFCGLHKVGGWAAQETTSSVREYTRKWEEEDDEDVPGLSFSQHTLSSSQNSLVGLSQRLSSSAKKRSYEDDVEDDMDAFFDEADAADAAAAASCDTSRPIARMRGSAPRKTTHNSVVRIFGTDDFEEAAFLAPMDDMEVD